MEVEEKMETEKEMGRGTEVEGEEGGEKTLGKK